jgi:hypothetical protein
LCNGWGKLPDSVPASPHGLAAGKLQMMLKSFLTA